MASSGLHVCALCSYTCVLICTTYTHVHTHTRLHTRTRIHTHACPKLIKRSVHPDWELCDPMAMTLSWCHPRDGQAYLGCWGCQAHIEYTKFDGEASSTAQRLPEPGFNIVFCVYVCVCMYADMCSCKSVYTCFWCLSPPPYILYTNLETVYLTGPSNHRLARLTCH